MEEQLDKIEGYVEDIIFRNEDNGYTVFTLSYKDMEITCTGVTSNLFSGQYIELEGKFINHTTYGEQFNLQSYIAKEPQTKEAFLRFISSGAVPGIRKKRGEKIADKFGDDSYKIMLEEPELLAKEIKGISINQAYSFQAFLLENQESTQAALFLQKYGISANLAKKVFKRYGDGIYTLLKSNPYRLAEDIDGVGFKKADDIARKLGINVDSEYRIRAATLYALDLAADNGHTYLPIDDLQKSVESLLDLHCPDFDALVADLSIENKLFAKTSDQDRVRIYLPSLYKAEEEVAYHLARLQGEEVKFDACMESALKDLEDNGSKDGIELDSFQMEAIKAATKNGILVITGGPGTGKTTVINEIIRVFEASGLEVDLAAPTGRASKRMSEACKHKASTIHRLLGYGQNFIGDSKDKDAFDKRALFEHDKDNQLETDVLIVDEMSMVDLRLMKALLEALATGTRLILVGDEDQLPSVGPGRVLGDIIDSEAFLSVRLEKIFRQAAESDIISNAHKINKGQEVDLSKRSKDFLFIKRDDPDKIISAIYTLISEKLPEYVGAKVEDIQILTPSKASKVGVERLNIVMQNMLNPQASGKQEKKYKEIIFREGDKVMQIKNDYQLEWYKQDKNGYKETGLGAFNGDTGIISDINSFSEKVTVDFDDGRVVRYDFADLDQLNLAYAITIHKSQGSEYPAVIIPMYQAPKMLMNRKLLYTAVTRARKCVCLVGMPEYFEQMEDNVYEYNRFSSLKERIEEAINEK